MTIEATLERIAAALETIAANGPKTLSSETVEKAVAKPVKTTKTEAPKESPKSETANDSTNSGSETTGEESSPSDSAPSRDDMLKACTKFVQSHGPDKLQEVMGTLNASKFSEVPADRYGDLQAALDAEAALS